MLFLADGQAQIAPVPVSRPRAEHLQ